jgi:hypothetical protein|tara:strand:+ start:48156 stop:48311 length:156 start_codon:yes stop_codon:yes gene_type:complete
MDWSVEGCEVEWKISRPVSVLNDVGILKGAEFAKLEDERLECRGAALLERV